MNRSKWFRLNRALFYALPPIAVLSLTTVAATRPMPSGTSESLRAAKAWVEAHRDALPTRLEDVAAMPYDYRGVILAALPIEQQGALWRDHWTAFVTPASEQTPLHRRIVAGLSKPLTAEQIEFLRAEIADVHNAYSSALTAEERSQKGTARCARTYTMFERGDGHLLMRRLGGLDDKYLWATRSGDPLVRVSPTSKTWSIVTPVRAAAMRFGIVPPPNMAACICEQPDVGWPCCGDQQVCVQSWPTCTSGSCACGGTCDGGKCADIK